MIKVFLAEDEIVMREGIKNNIDWNAEGFEFVGEASDGELALPLIQKTKPDILVTDIKMPFMDGLELSRYVKKELPDIKIVFLSGYNDFEYAREAIRIGVAEYLVKPISGAQLLEAIKKIAKQIQAEREQKLYLEKFLEDQQENARIEKMKFLKKLVSGRYTVSELLKEGLEIGLELVAQQYNIMLLQVSSKSDQEGYSEEKNEAAAVLRHVVEKHPELVMIEGVDEWIILIKQIGEKTVEEIEEELKKELLEAFRDMEKIEFFGGMGEPVARLSELNRCYEEASYSFTYRFIEQHNQVVHGKDIRQKQMASQELQLTSIKVDSLDRKVVETFLKIGLKSEARAFVDDYFSSIGEKNMSSCIFRQYVALDMCFAAAAMVEQLGYDSGELMEKCGNADVAAASFAGIEETKRLLTTLYEEAIEMREVVSRKKYSVLLEDAKAYIGQNYSNEEISLNTVAASINMSPNHFSSIFKQETGETFVEYLTAVRMEKAKELLRGTSMKTSEIAVAVGYKDSHYFSYLFKKTQECTPREFRNGE